MSKWEKATYALAEKLGLTVQQLREQMSMAEFMGWLDYYESLQASHREPVLDVTTLSPDKLKELFPG